MGVLTGLLRMAALWALTLPAIAAESPLQEIHGDWQVACAARDGTNHCALLQQQRATSGEKQRVLAVELTRVGSAAQGMLVLPFGLSLARGVRLQLDAEPALPAALHFRTCIPAGCLVPLHFDADYLARLRSAALLRIHAETADSGNATVFTVSLRGFGDAFERAAALAP